MKVLLDEEAVQAGVHRLARQISHWYGDDPLTILGVMTGSVLLLADVIRLLKMPLRVGAIHASSYRGETTRGDLIWNEANLPPIKDQHVLLVDDIFDTGNTISRLLDALQNRNPKSLRSAVLLEKLGQAQVPIRPDHVVFQIPNEFVVGYGLDFRDQFRNLPYVAVLEASDIEASSL